MNRQRRCLSLLLSLLLVVTILQTQVKAEVVYVKYRGALDLEGFECKFTSSSFVKRICYQRGKQYLLVQLKDTYYHYCRIPSLVVEAWHSASSLGNFYLDQIRGRYDCRQGGVPE